MRAFVCIAMILVCVFGIAGLVVCAPYSSPVVGVFFVAGGVLLALAGIGGVVGLICEFCRWL